MRSTACRRAGARRAGDALAGTGVSAVSTAANAANASARSAALSPTSSSGIGRSRQRVGEAAQRVDLGRRPGGQRRTKGDVTMAQLDQTCVVQLVPQRAE